MKLTIFLKINIFILSDLTRSILGAHNFLNFNLFWVIFNMLNMSIGGVQVLFGHQKQRSLPFGLSLP
jgi:hypothetical protein